MRRLVFVLGLGMLIVWTLLGLGAWTFVGGAGDLLIDIGEGGGAPGQLLAWVFGLLRGLGLGVIAIVWFAGAGLLFGAMRMAMRVAAPVDAAQSVRMRDPGLGPGGTIWRGTESPPRRAPALNLEQGPDGTWRPAGEEPGPDQAKGPASRP